MDYVVPWRCLESYPGCLVVLAHAERTLTPGGVVAMWDTGIRPGANRFHPKPFEPEARGWSFPEKEKGR